MKPEQILHALNAIDEEFILEARTEAAPRRRVRLSTVIAALIALLAITACAAGELGGWLESFFTARSGSALSSHQLGYLAQYGQTVNESQTQNGYTVTLASYIGTEDTVYVVFQITAPKRVDLTSDDSNILMDAEFTGVYGRTPDSIVVRRMDDGDGKSNTIYYICILQHKEYLYYSVPEWNVQIHSLYRVLYNPETKQHTYPVLAEGPWDFTIDLTKSDTQTVELLTEPIQTLAIIPHLDSVEDTLESVTVTSVVLSPLDVMITYEPVNEGNASFTGFVGSTGIELHAYAVMKDGSFVSLDYGHPSRHGQAKLLADTPILPDQVDYLLFADGTRLMVP